MSYAKETAINWLGGVVLVMAVFGGICTLIWANGEYGNRLAKTCIENKGEWVLKDAYHNKWECRRDND